MKWILVLCVCGLVMFPEISAVVLSQDDVRGAFLVSRPKEKPQSAGSSSRPTRKRPRTTPGAKDSKSSNQQGSTSNTAGTTPGTGSTTTDPKANPVNKQHIGLGLTLFMRDSTGLAVRVDPTRVFSQGDAVRLLMETNTDGYIYIFNTTNNGSPVMLYPNAQLDEGGNYLQAHVPFEVPAGIGAEERLRWLVFDEHAGEERLYFVFTREPLAGVPIEDELISFCRDKSSCEWKPTEEIWTQIKKEMGQPLKMDKAKQFGAAQTQNEKEATTRGLGLAKDDPPPSLIMMSSTVSSMLVTTLDLIHK